MTELAAGHTCRQREVADGDLLVHEGIRKVILALSHGTHEDADALLGAYRLDVLTSPHERRVKAQRHLATVGGEMVSDRVLDHA